MTTLCLLCAKSIHPPLSWQALCNLVNKKVLCESCSKQFKRADIIEEGSILDSVHSLFVYDDVMREWLHQYKFLQDIALAEVVAGDLQSVLSRKDIIVPIPMHKDRARQRTFSHVEALLEYSGIPYINLLEKTTTSIMGEKTKEERLKMEPLFQLKSNVTIMPVTYKLIDDIYTTGTTLQQAAKLLKDAGASRVEAVTIIRSVQN